ncbi:MAG: hypothetical protein QOJ22_702 [Thermoleophilaceae bacterium]|nr:hypothetical protein [Thermoleophilaceae bacterium]
MRRSRLTLLLIAVALTGCDRAPTTRADNGIVNLRVRDYRYDHQSVRVRAGAITFKVTNAGLEPTNFRVRREGRKRDLVSIATLVPGGIGSTTAKLRPGEYVMHSSVGRNETLGEYGRLVVTRRGR